jgi:hypothetical protein
MRNSNERISINKIVLTHLTNELDNCPGGHSIEVHDFSFPAEGPSPAEDP